ncbi:MAG: HD domain-containing protein [Betaproteobacteria bacterium]|nr:HD domain-containing protein [Betaproteobacteria bacterium]MDH5222499.1 HD domain-containing protein [Betaproteobacteria bacterium]MDH5352107.1 HD domain-containing protein [Betaproteobacteria bacterium]
MDSYQDSLEALNRNLPLRDKLIQTHRVMQAQLPFVARVAVALYDPKTNLLKSYLHSSGEDDPLSRYHASLSDAPSLADILKEGRPRVINNMLTFDDGRHEHTRRIGRQGYAASYTMPIFNNGAFVGFVFFNSRERDVFTQAALNQLDVFGHLVALMVVNEMTAMRTLVAAVTTTSHFTHVRDVETGSHIDRMSRYARLIARELAPRHRLDDEYIEHVFMYSPLHDIGKIAIPDRILLKPGRLDAQESEIMRGHARKGREIIDEVLANFGLDALQHVNILRNIAEYHHEAMNGKGYPASLEGEGIPLEARIVAVADVFDALTSPRPYKDAWTNDEAFATLQRLAGETLDGECVQALVRGREEVERIQEQFSEDRIG